MKKKSLCCIIILMFMFCSCKRFLSDTSALVEKKGDTCFFTYMKMDVDESGRLKSKTPLRYCVTECTECPTQPDIDEFNKLLGLSGKLVNEKCSLTAETQDKTVYIDKVTEGRNEYILSKENGLEIEYLEDDEEPLKFMVEDIKHDNILEKCSREVSHSSSSDKKVDSSSTANAGGVVSSVKASQNNKSIADEYKIGLCSTNLVLAHMVNGKTVDAIWKIEVINPYEEKNYFTNLSIPAGYRLPKKSECNKKLVTALNWLLSKKMSVYDDPVRDGEGLDRFWLAEEDQENEGRQLTCMYNGKVSASRKDLAFAYLVLVQESDIEVQSKKCSFVSYSSIKVFNNWLNSLKKR